MRQITVNVYKFNELSKEVKETVIKRYYENEDYPFLTDDLLERLKEEDKKKVFSNVKLAYSLSCCRGDGLSFSADIDVSAWLADACYADEYKERIINGVYHAGSKGNKGHYCYASTSDIVLESESGLSDEIEKHIEKIQADIAVYYLNICKTLERTGYSILEYRMSIEEFNEHAEANNYEYYEDGEQA